MTVPDCITQYYLTPDCITQYYITLATSMLELPDSFVIQKTMYNTQLVDNSPNTIESP